MFCMEKWKDKGCFQCKYHEIFVKTSSTVQAFLKSCHSIDIALFYGHLQNAFGTYLQRNTKLHVGV
jgi:hypothetical protein